MIYLSTQYFDALLREKMTEAIGSAVEKKKPKKPRSQRNGEKWQKQTYPIEQYTANIHTTIIEWISLKEC